MGLHYDGRSKLLFNYVLNLKFSISTEYFDDHGLYAEMDICALSWKEKIIQLLFRSTR